MKTGFGCSDTKMKGPDRSESPKRMCLDDLRAEPPVLARGQSRPRAEDPENLCMQTAYGGYMPCRIGPAVQEAARSLRLDLPEYIAALIPTYLTMLHVAGLSREDSEQGTKLAPPKGTSAPDPPQIYLSRIGNCRAGPWLRKGQTCTLRIRMGTQGTKDGWMFGVGIARRDYIWDRTNMCSNGMFMTNSKKRWNYFCAQDGRSCLYHAARMMPLPFPAAAKGEVMELTLTADQRLLYSVRGMEPLELPIDEPDMAQHEWAFLMQVYGLTIKLLPPARDGAARMRWT